MGGFPGGAFSETRAKPGEEGKKIGDKGEKSEKKDLKNLCRLVYTINIERISSRKPGGQEVAALRELKLDRYKGSLLLKFAVLCLAGFILVSFIGQQRQIAEKQETLQALQAQLATQNVKNEELRASIQDEEGLREYAERKARQDLNYAMPGERVFVDAGASN